MKPYRAHGVTGILIMIVAAMIITEAAAAGSEDAWENEPTAILSCFGYGYKAGVLINGAETNIRGEKSEEMRLFYESSKLASEAPAAIKKFFLLNKGENRIQAEFEKTGASGGLTLYVWLESEPVPSFFLHTRNKDRGRLDKKFIMKSPLPKDFRPVVISDAGENKAVLIFVANPAVVEATLNDKSGPYIGGTIGPIVMENVKSGKNDLTVTYQADPTATKEIRIGIVTPEWTRFISKKVTGTTVTTEKFIFKVK